jgi:inhibitor of cysteine peptidase
MNKLLYGVLLMSLALVGASCDSDDDDDEIIIRESQSGSEVVVSTGDRILVILDSQPSTGYTWGITELDEAVVRRCGDPGFSASSDVVGAPGVDRWPFKAEAVGETTLKMEYRRSWEGGSPERRFEVKLIVQ